jgi:hypothetical protein
MFRYWKPRCAILFAIGVANFAARAQQGDAAAAAEKKAVEFCSAKFRRGRGRTVVSRVTTMATPPALFTRRKREGAVFRRRCSRIPPHGSANPRGGSTTKAILHLTTLGLPTCNSPPALASAFQAGETKNRTALEEAARKVAADQDADGAWQIEPANAVGSPVTYGTTLATYMALNTLRAARLSETENRFARPSNGCAPAHRRMF